jgi:NitT/TauT family transport system substrate-binding protein
MCVSTRWWRHLATSLTLVTVLATIACGGGTLTSSRGPAESSAPPAAGGSTGGASGPASSAAAPAVQARSAYTTISAAAAPWWIALDGGYFREQGLDVDLVHIDAGAPLLAALSNGELDITFAGGPSLVLGVLQGFETMTIGSTSNMLEDSVFVRNGIQTVDDLRGGTIGVTNLKAITDVAARLGLKRLGLEADVDFFPRRTGGLAESLAGLETGALDGASINVPATFEARKRGFRELVDVTAMQVAFLSSGVGATKKKLAERPELPDRYLRALAQAVARIKTDRDYTVQIMGKYTQMSDLDLLGATVDVYRPLYTTDPYPERVAVQATLDVEENPAARTARPEDVVDYRYGDALRASGFLDTLPK